MEAIICAILSKKGTCMRRQTRIALVMTMFAYMLVLIGCVGNASTPGTVYYYTLDYQSEAPNAPSRLPVVLRVNRFSVSPPFNTQRIVYAEKNLHRNTYAYHHWIAQPGELLSYLLTRDLEYYNGFRAVLPADAIQPATHDVYGWVEEFIEIDDHNPWQASVRIHITLASALDPDASRRILMQKRYSQKADCKEKTPAALAQAMSVAVASIYKKVVYDIHTRLKTDHNQESQP
jgi:ABC-type uncharacterized transport system auxiliary subunit